MPVLLGNAGDLQERDDPQDPLWWNRGLRRLVQWHELRLHVPRQRDDVRHGGLPDFDDGSAARDVQ
jgi:hypothetical protein